MFGDYAVDTTALQKPQRRTPSAHIRYSTLNEYIVEKGQAVKKPIGYDAIYPVADALVARSEFKGAAYSEGDKYFSDLANRATGPGTPSDWRWAATDHHLTLNVNAINAMFGIIEQEPASSVEPLSSQGILFPELISPSTAPNDTKPLETPNLEKPEDEA